MYKVIGTRILADSEGNPVSVEVRDYGLTKEEIQNELWREDLKWK